MMTKFERTAITLVSRAALLTGAVALLAMIVFRAGTWWSTLQVPGALVAITLGLTAALALFLFAIRASTVSVKRLAGELVLLGIVLAVAEILVLSRTPEAWTHNVGAKKFLEREHAARKLKVPVDRRSISEVVLDLRAQGIQALPGVARSWPRQPETRAKLRGQFHPLSHASRTRIVECNEGGQYMIYETDEFGFNNPAGLVKSGEVDVAVLGESHTLGHCVPQGQGFVDVIRASIPRTANFAMAYTLSLTQLGSLREYVKPLRPPLVLWVVNPGLAVVTGDEEEDPVLQRYLAPSFSQHLMSRQDEVDQVMRELTPVLQDASDRQLHTEVEHARAQRFSKFYALGKVRDGLDLSRTWRPGPPIPNMTLFEQSLRVARDTVDGWGGELVVMVLPAYAELMGSEKEALRHKAVLDVTRGLNIRVIDAAETFLGRRDFSRLYILGTSNHPNEQGHALLGARALEELTIRLSSINHHDKGKRS